MLLPQELNGLLAGERGYIRLKNLQKKLRTRQQYMVSQVSLLYPVKITAGPAEDQELESFPSSSRLGMCYANSLTLCTAFSFLCYLRNKTKDSCHFRTLTLMKRECERDRKREVYKWRKRRHDKCCPNLSVKINKTTYTSC